MKHSEHHFIQLGRGFTLIELLITMAIIGILVTIAVPSYQQYTRRAHYTEIVQAAAPYKLGIEACFELMGDLSHCRIGENNVPPAISHLGLVDHIAIDPRGKITITPRTEFGITAKDTYVLTPRIEQEHLLWTTSGGGVKHGYTS